MTSFQETAYTVHLMDGNSKHGILSVCPRKDRVYRPGHRLTRPRMYDLVADSSDSVQQTAAVSCSTEITMTTQHTSPAS